MGGCNEITDADDDPFMTVIHMADPRPKRPFTPDAGNDESFLSFPPIDMAAMDPEGSLEGFVFLKQDVWIVIYRMISLTSSVIERLSCGHSSSPSRRLKWHGVAFT